MSVNKMDAVIVERLSKRFHTITIPKQTTLKEALVSLQMFNRLKDRERFVNAVTDISFTVRRGSTIGVIGKNGSGKTTLMRLLAGIYTPTSGSIRIAGEIALLSLGVGFHSDMTGRENIKINGLVLGLTRRQIDRKFDDIVDFAELREFIDAPVRTYSSGMYMRLAFSVAVNVNPDILLLDEILAVGDEAFSAKCHTRMKEYKAQGKTIVLVTHDPSTLIAWCETAIWMDRGLLRLQGPAQQVIDAYHAEMHLSQADRALQI